MFALLMAQADTAEGLVVLSWTSTKKLLANEGYGRTVLGKDMGRDCSMRPTVKPKTSEKSSRLVSWFLVSVPAKH